MNKAIAAMIGESKIKAANEKIMSNARLNIAVIPGADICERLVRRVPSNRNADQNRSIV
jgi:hypothetical protein